MAAAAWKFLPCVLSSVDGAAVGFPRAFHRGGLHAPVGFVTTVKHGTALEALARREVAFRYFRNHHFWIHPSVACGGKLS